MSQYIGKRVQLMDATGTWWDALMEDCCEIDGNMFYSLLLDNGDSLKIPVDDISAILEKRKKYKAGKCAVIPFKRKA